MITILTLRATISSQHFAFSYSRFSKTQNHFYCLCFQSNPPPSMPPKFVAEYAKSSRSQCKKCTQSISAKALRLGLVSRHPNGFDSTKWYHVDCFPEVSGPIDSADSINGFSSLKGGDQEALTKLVAQSKSSIEKIAKTDDDVVEEPERNSRKIEISKTDDDDDEELESDSKRIKLSTTTKEAGPEILFSVSDIKDMYKDAKLLPKWKAFQTIIFLERDDGLHDSNKVAAFDFDGCLVDTNVRKVGADAWSVMHPSVPEKLLSLYKDGYKLVIFTNESNIERWKNKRQVAVDSKLGRLNNFIKHVKVPIQVFVACGLSNTKGKAEDPFRKPKTGMWRIMEKHFNSGISIDMDQSFYVGDAAGRKNDHSDADIKFAQAIGLKFYVPEEYFTS